MRNFKLLPPALYYLFLVFVCKGNKIICCTQIILLKSLCFYLLLTFTNKYIYILNTVLQIKVLPHLIIYRAIVRGSGWWRCLPGVGGVLGGWCRWCPRGGWWCPPWCSLVAGGGSLVSVEWSSVVSWCPRWCSSVAGGASLVLPGGWCPRGVLVVSMVSSWWLVVAPWQPRPHIHSRTRRRGHATLLSAAALSLMKRSCKASLLDAIALIINYLGVPLGMAFTGWHFS